MLESCTYGEVISVFLLIVADQVNDDAGRQDRQGVFAVDHLDPVSVGPREEPLGDRGHGRRRAAHLHL